MTYIGPTLHNLDREWLPKYIQGRNVGQNLLIKRIQCRKSCLKALKYIQATSVA